MKALVIFAPFLLVLASPATAQDGRLHCDSPRECEVMWSAAQDAVGLLSNMRIRLSTESRIETFAPNDFGRTGATATKSPSGAAGYDFKVEIECYRHVRCDGLQAAGAELFALQVESAKRTASYAAPAALPASSSADGPPQPVALQASRAALRRVESMGELRACSSKPSASFVGARPEQQTYVVACTNGDALAVGCTETACRVLK